MKYSCWTVFILIFTSMNKSWSFIRYCSPKWPRPSTKYFSYLTDSSLSWDRQGSDVEEQKERMRNKWKVSADPKNTNGNIRAYFDNDKTILGDFSTDVLGTMSYFQISSALALYRTISLFECGVDNAHADFYKMNWYIPLEHKETKTILGLGEWKGGFQIFTPYNGLDQASPKYKTDLKELLNLLVSPTMTIGYDGVVAGTVA